MQENINENKSEKKVKAKEQSNDDIRPSESYFSIEEKISKFNKLFACYEGLSWEKMPDIELYMDQIVTLIDRHLGIYKLNEEDKIVTPSMINNYTKDRVVPRAESKKYSKEHIALILMVVSLKKVLSMPDLHKLLKGFEINKNCEIEEFYNKFLHYQKQAVSKSTTEVENFLEKNSGDEKSGEKILKDLALELAVKSHINCILSEHILNILADKENGNKSK